jgi:hypothetical protein
MQYAAFHRTVMPGTVQSQFCSYRHDGCAELPLR